MSKKNENAAVKQEQVNAEQAQPAGAAVELAVDNAGAAPVVAGAKKPQTETEKRFGEESAKEVVNLLALRDSTPKYEGDELVKFVQDETALFIEVGEGIKTGTIKSAERWAVWSKQIPMTVKADGTLNIMKFLDTIWDMLAPAAKVEQDGKPGKFYKWSTCEGWKIPAAMVLGNMRKYLSARGSDLYPELVGPKVVSEGAEYKQVSRSIDKILELTYLPKTHYVEVGEDGTPVAGAAPVTLEQILRDFYKEAVEPHLPKKETAKDKAEAAEKEQNAEQELTEEELLARLEQVRAKKA